MTSIIGGASPIFPHPSVNDFYKWASCHNDIERVRVPLLAINSDDDPIVQEIPYDQVEKNEGGWVALVVTKGGGHLGWFEGHDGKIRWINKPVIEWLRAMAEEVVWNEDRWRLTLDQAAIQAASNSPSIQNESEFEGFAVRSPIPEDHVRTRERSSSFSDPDSGTDSEAESDYHDAASIVSSTPSSVTTPPLTRPTSSMEVRLKRNEKKFILAGDPHPPHIGYRVISEGGDTGEVSVQGALAGL
jgi:hypothetical protein